LRTSNLLLLLLPLLLTLGLQACYSGYAIQRDDLTKLQSGGTEKVVTVRSQSGEDLQVAEGTGVEIFDHDGLTYRLAPFTFKVTSTQLVAPEQDLVLPLGFIERIEVRKLNTWGTIGLFGLGVLAAGGVVVGVVATAGEDTGF